MHMHDHTFVDLSFPMFYLAIIQLIDPIFLYFNNDLYSQRYINNTHLGALFLLQVTLNGRSKDAITNNLNLNLVSSRSMEFDKGLLSVSIFCFASHH